MYEQNTCKNTWKKARKRKQNFFPNNQIITACHIELRVQEMTMNEKLTMNGLKISWQQKGLKIFCRSSNCSGLGHS